MITEIEIATMNLDILNNIKKDMAKSIFPKRFVKYSNVVLESCETHKKVCERFLLYLIGKRISLQKAKKGEVIIFDEVKESDLGGTIKLYRDYGI